MPKALKVMPWKKVRVTRLAERLPDREDLIESEEKSVTPWPLPSTGPWSHGDWETSWPDVKALLNADPNTRLCKVTIYQNDIVLGVKTTYESRGGLFELPRIYSKDGWYGHESKEREPTSLELAVGEYITSVGAGIGYRSLNSLVLRTSAGRELVGGDRTRAVNGGFFDIPTGHELAAFSFTTNENVLRPHLITLPCFWKRWGWLLLWRKRLEAAAITSTSTGGAAAEVDVEPTDLTERLEAPTDASRAGSRAERLVARLVQLDEDTFRLVASMLV